MSQGPALTRDNALITSNLTPFERLNDIEYRYENLAPIIGTMKNEYAWFLETTDKPKLEMLDWISKQENRDEAFRHAGIFVNNMGELVKSVAEQNGYLRYLIV